MLREESEVGMEEGREWGSERRKKRENKPVAQPLCCLAYSENWASRVAFVKCRSLPVSGETCSNADSALFQIRGCLCWVALWGDHIHA